MLSSYRWSCWQLVIGIVLASSCAEAAQAQWTMPNHRPVNQLTVPNIRQPAVEILVDNKVVSRLPVQAHWFWGKTGCFVLPEYGTTYQIRLSVPSSHHPQLALERFLFDIEVDGLSVMTGRPSSGRPHGYVVQSGSSAIISGWRVDDQHVRKFEVSVPAESLAATNGSSGNTGRIRVRVFRERRQNSLLNIPQTSSGKLENSYSPAGTAQGEKALSKVRFVNFDTDFQSMIECNFTYSVASGDVLEKKAVDSPEAAAK